MRRIEITNAFKRDYKREAKGKHRLTLERDIQSIVQSLANDEPLEQRYQDHSLAGEWSDHRDCHIKPDLVLIYRKSNPDRVQLVRLGSHSELGL
ncbi:MAG: type II toxin-antitoxin system YafQ family toxin [Actinomycetota bacterium]|nr:type II toxin-antitoxin system YafQ family toxin [Actinomycetota bacterium]